MKKRILSLILCICIISVFVFDTHQKASADVLSISMVAGAALAIGQTFGIDFTNNTWNSTGVENMMEGEVSSYCGSRTLSEVFGSEVLRAVAGKLVVGQTAYNAIVNFLNYINLKYNLGLNRVGLGFMFGDDYAVYNQDGTAYLNGWSCDIVDSGTSYWVRRWFGPDGQTSYTSNNDVSKGSYPNVDGPNYFVTTNGILCRYFFSNDRGSGYTRNDTLGWNRIYPDTADRPKQVYATSTGDIGSATIINPGYGWAGTVPGYDDPDTNLDQILGGIFEGVADTSLDVDGEVIPLDPPQPVPTWAPVDDVIDGINQGGEVITDIGADIGDITGSLDGIQEGIGDLTDALPDITDAITDQTETIGSIAETLEDEAIDWRTFDLRRFFPFCIPFDIYNMLEALDASPTAPHVQIPFVIPSLSFSYTIDLDFSAFDSVAAVLRQMELILYGLTLAWATSKVIKW